VPTPTKIAKIRQLWTTPDRKPAASECTILTGLGALYAGFDMEQGIDGFMTGFAFPEILTAMADANKRGDLGRVFELYQEYLPLLVFEQQPGIAVRKELYRLRGLIDCGAVRHPGGSIDPVAAAALRRQIERSLPGCDITKPLPAALLARAGGESAPPP
jgi:4-hydroxy-tetrahydrodipicolinate synthase